MKEFDDPRYQPYRIGPLLFDEVEKIVKGTVSKEPYRNNEQTWNDGVGWSENEYAALASEVITDFLIKGNQLGYVMRAETIGALHYRIGQQITRCLSARRDQNVIDRLLERAGKNYQFWYYESQAELSLETIDGIAQSLRDIRPNYEAERRVDRVNESPVFDKAQLEEILRRILNFVNSDKDAGKSINRSELRKIFEKLLTDWLAKPLIRDENQIKTEPDPLSNVRNEEIRIEMQKAINDLNDYEVRIFKRVVIDGAEFSRVADEVDKTRQTVSTNVKSIAHRLRSVIEDKESRHEREVRAEIFAQELLSRYERS